MNHWQQGPLLPSLIPAVPGLYFYTLADWQGELLLASPEPLDWPQAVQNAVRQADMDGADDGTDDDRPSLNEVYDKLRLAHPGLVKVRAPSYYHLGHGSTVPSDDSEGRPT